MNRLVSKKGFEITIKWIRKRVLISVSNSSKVVKSPYSLATLILITSLHPFLVLLKVWFYWAKLNCNFCFLISRQRKRWKRAASWRNSPKIIIGESKLVWMIGITKVVTRFRSYRSKKDSWLSCSGNWTDIAVFYLRSVSTERNMISL